MILADTSVWVDYLLGQNPKMQKRLAQAQIVMHPMIVAEISLGSLNNRRKRLQEMEALLEVRAAKPARVRHMVEAHLLASCLITPGTQLWTCDSKMERVAHALAIPVNLP